MKKEDVKKLEEHLQNGHWFFFGKDEEMHELRLDIHARNLSPFAVATSFGQNIKTLLLRAEDSANGIQKDANDYNETDLNLDILLRRGFWIYIQNIKIKGQPRYLLSIRPSCAITAPAVYQISTKVENGFIGLLKRAEYAWAQYITEQMRKDYSKDKDCVYYYNSYSELKPEDRNTL